MSIVSFLFVFFVLITIALYYAVPIRFRWMALLAASIAFFVLTCGIVALPVLMADAFCGYLAARLIERDTTEKGRKRVLVLALAIIFGLLFFTKTLDTLLQTVSHLIDYPIGAVNSILYITGISYFTLSLAGYVIDVYREEYPAQRSYFKVLLFVCYFPLMTAGPIVRYGEVQRELFEGIPYQEGRVSAGLERVLWGFFKKLLIADYLAKPVAAFFGNPQQYAGFEVLFVIVCCALQLYADFSGLIDIVLGISECFGVRLPENFDVPFSSRSVIEFFRRWHMTLGLWFKDYVLYPVLASRFMKNLIKRVTPKLGKQQAKRLATNLGLIVVWFCVGLWHSALIKDMVASGLLPFIYIVAGEATGALRTRLNKLLKRDGDCFSARLLSRAVTFCLLSVCFIVSRSSGMQVVSVMVKQLFSVNNPWVLIDGSLYSMGFSGKQALLVLFSLLALLAVDILHSHGVKIRETLARQNIVFRWGVVIALLFLVIICGAYNANYASSNFLYASF